MARRNIMTRLDQDVAGDADVVVDKVRKKRPRSRISRQDVINEAVAYALRAPRFLRAIGAA